MVARPDNAGDLSLLPSDLNLVERTREGDTEAFGELWERHRKAGLKAARTLTSSYDPEDLVQEAFLKILATINNGAGPREAFRPYLYSVLRSISMSWKAGSTDTDDLTSAEILPDTTSNFEGQVIDRAITGRAFAALRTEWRAVLWYSEVESMTAKEIATIFGLTPNATSALIYRAREGLRVEWLQAHLNYSAAADECRWTVQRLGRYNRNSLGKREHVRAKRHLSLCLKCSILLAEVDELGRNLGIVLLPVFLGAAGLSMHGLAHAPTSQTPAAGGQRETGPSTSVGSVMGRHSGGASIAKIGALTVALTVGGLGVFAALPPSPETAIINVAPPAAAAKALPVPENPPPLGSTSATEPSHASTTPQETPAAKPTPTAVPLPFPSPTQVPRQFAPPVTPPSKPQPSPSPVATPPAPNPPHSPSAKATPSPTGTPSSSPTPSASAPAVTLEAPVITSVLNQGLFLPLVSGTGVPGSTIHILGAQTEVATTIVGADGTWSISPANMPQGVDVVRFTAIQSANGMNSMSSNESEPTTVSRPKLISLDTASTTPQVTFSGPAGSVVEAFLDGKPTGVLHQMTGNPVTRTISAQGTHTLSLRFADVVSGLYGATVDTEFTVTSTD